MRLERNWLDCKGLSLLYKTRYDSNCYSASYAALCHKECMATQW